MPHIKCNNASIFYEASGASEETIVFSHGLLFNHHMWDEQVKYFSKKYRCIAYDHRGQGKSTITSPMDMDTLCEDAACLIAQLSPGKPVHFVGLSMGGFVGMRLAARKPELLKSLTLIETSPDTEPDLVRNMILVLVFKLVGPKPVSNKVMKILFGKSFLADPGKKQIVNFWKKTIESYPASITKAINGVIHRKSIYDEITKIKVPTQVVVGEEDLATKVDKAERIHRQISNSSITVIPQAGHSSCIEQPEKVNELLEKFIVTYCN